MTKAELELAKKRHKFGIEGKKKQAEREKFDLGFYEGEGQWPDDIKSLRAGQQAQNNMPAVPARPCLTINKVRDPIRRIQNDELQADFGVSIVPADDFGGEIDESEIELREGLARRIQRQSNAKDAVMWAANRAAICGTGWYGLTTKWVDSDSVDKEIIYERFYDQFSIVEDPAHEQPDGSDIEWAFVGRDIPWDTYREEFPYRANGQRNALARAAISNSAWEGFMDLAPDWVKQDGEHRTVRVARYWRYDRERYDLVAMSDGSVVRLDSLPKQVQKSIPPEAIRERVIKHVKCALLDGLSDDGDNALEEYDWPGKFIPLVKVVGEEIHVFDKERRCEGLIRPAIDSQKSFNVMISSAVESIAVGSKSRWLVPVGALENVEQIWAQSAVRNYPYLPYNATDAGTGQPLPPPTPNTSEAPIQAMAVMMGAFDQSIMATIGQANLADTHPDVRSGQMASTIIEEAARGTSNYLANLIRSRHREGDILNDLLYPVYGTRPGRILSMMNSSHKTERVMIGQPFVNDTANGMPKPYDANQHKPEQQKTYALTKDGSFNVAIEVNKYYETKQQEKLALIAGVVEKDPAQMAIIGDRFMELAGDDELAKRYTAVLDPRVVEMLKSGQPPDPRIQQLVQQLQQVGGELLQLRADKHARIEQAQIKAVADATTTDKDNETKLAIAQGNNATAILIAEMANSIKEQGEQVKLLVQADQARQEEMRTIEAFMEERRLSEERSHSAASMLTDHAHERRMAEVDHEHDMELTEHEARVNPKSTNGSGE